MNEPLTSGAEPQAHTPLSASLAREAALQALLNVADQRVDDLETQLHEHQARAA